MADQPNADDYLFARDYRASARSLIPEWRCETALRRKQIGFPASLLAERSRVSGPPSDRASGNRCENRGCGHRHRVFQNAHLRFQITDPVTHSIWATDLARLLPASATVYGLDLITSQCPPRTWLPDNVHMERFNVLGKLREDYIGAFDFVHVRLFMFVVSDPRPMLQNVMRMLSRCLDANYNPDHCSCSIV